MHWKAHEARKRLVYCRASCAFQCGGFLNPFKHGVSIIMIRSCSTDGYELPHDLAPLASGAILALPYMYVASSVCTICIVSMHPAARLCHNSHELAPRSKSCMR